MMVNKKTQASKKVDAINKKKVRAYDLLQEVYASVAEQKRLQQELAKVENEIAEFKNE